MKKIMVLLLVVVFVFGSILTVVAQDTVDKKVKITEKLNKLQNTSEAKGTPNFITGHLSENAINNDSDALAGGFTAAGIEISTDTYEPNGSMTDAYGLTNGLAYSSYIFYRSDEDYYYFNTKGAGTILVTLTNLPSNYDLYLLNSDGTAVAKSQNGSTSDESIYFQTDLPDKFYIKVVGYGAYSTTQPYELKVIFPDPQWYYEFVNEELEQDDYNNSIYSYTYEKLGAQSVDVHISIIQPYYGDILYIRDLDNNIVATYEYDMLKYVGMDGIWASVGNCSIRVELVRSNTSPVCDYYIDQVGYYLTYPLF